MLGAYHARRILGELNQIDGPQNRAITVGAIHQLKGLRFHHTMRSTSLAVLCVFLLLLTHPALADIGKVYSGSSGYEIAARVEDGKVYSGSSGYTVAARIDGNRIYAGASGYTVLARFEGGKIYAGASGYTVIGRIEGLTVYRGSSGYTVACRGEGTGGMSLAAAAAALCL
ncbi:MAG: hypothetical protein EBS01_01195 [Verrucomicrobia bacterium]|nr:hypothetical protein [Verrucomicrobiota bacterium]